MTTENLPQDSLDSPKPAAPAVPPAHYLDASLLSDRAMEEIDHLLTQADRDQIESARIAARQLRRAEQEKAWKESSESSKRAKDAVDDLVKRDRETPEDEKPTTDEPTQGYDLTIPEVSPENQQVLDDTVHDLALLGKEVGIPQEQVQTLVDLATDFALQEPPGLDYSNQEECENVLRGKWGKEYEQRVALVQAQVKRWGPTVAEYLSGTGLGNSPGVVEAIWQMASGNTYMSKANAEAEIAKMTADKNGPYWKGDKNAIAKMRTLREITSKGGATGPTRTVGGVSTTSEIESEIAAIRSNPDYTSPDSRKRAPLVARMNNLMAQIHG